MTEKNVVMIPRIRERRTVSIVPDCPLTVVMPVEITVCARCIYFGGTTTTRQFDCNYYEQEGDLSLKKMPVEMKERFWPSPASNIQKE